MKPSTMSTPYERMSSPLQAALEYSSLGWPVLPIHGVVEVGEGRFVCACGRVPCSHPGKHPATRHGIHEATTDPDLIRSWFTEWPDANVAVAMGAVSGLVCIDSDGRHGADLQIVEWDFEGLALRSGLHAVTPGGSHYLFRHPGGRIRSVPDFWPGIDVRADSSYIVVAPSRHASGYYYCWAADDEPDAPPGLLLAALERIWDRTAPPPPARGSASHRSGVSADRALLTPYGRGALLGEVAELRAAQNGNRNNRFSQAVRCIFELVGGNEIDGPYAEQVLRQVADEIGLEPDEIDDTFRHNSATGLSRPRQAPSGSGQLSQALAQDLAVHRETPVTGANGTRLRNQGMYDIILDLIEHRSKSREFYLDIRTAAQLEGIGDRAAWNALRALRDQGRIVLVRKGRRGVASRYRLASMTAAPVIPNTPTPPGTPSTSSSRNCTHKTPNCAESNVATFATPAINHDMFRWGWAGKSGHRIYEHLLTSGRKETRSEIAAATELRWNTVNYSIRKLVAYGLVERIGDAFAALEVDLDRRAEDLGVPDYAQEQRERHVAERARAAGRCP